MNKPLPASLSLRSWEKKDAALDKKRGIKEGSKKDVKMDAKATDQPNAASKSKLTKTTVPVQNYFSSKDVMKKKGKGY